MTKSLTVMVLSHICKELDHTDVWFSELKRALVGEVTHQDAVSDSCPVR